MTVRVRQVQTPKNFETIAWAWMRYSGILLIPLVWIHVILQDVLVGVHRIDLDYVAMRWALLGWRVYDALLLGFTFAHGMNGLRQVLNDFVHTESARRLVARLLFAFWLVITLIGAIAIIGGVRQP
ncbi:MAG: succinate dehydrogenase [Anaerolineae bacterium]|nr:succinate dehydrogenase [Anaerolineae bacterium]MDW8100980.1 succinate dehydrogenase [Anaerolineae bacterium]